MFKLWLPLWRQSVRISALFAFSQRASLSQSFAGVWLGRGKKKTQDLGTDFSPPFLFSAWI